MVADSIRDKTKALHAATSSDASQAIDAFNGILSDDKHIAADFMSFTIDVQ